MHILLLNDDFPPAGSSSVAIIAENLKRGYESRGHKVSVITTHRKENSDVVIRTGDIISLPISYRISLRHFKSIWMSKVSKMLKTEINRINPDVIHAHNIHTYLTYSALSISHKLAKKVIITMHDVFSFAFSRLSSEKYLESKGSDTKLSPLENLHAVGFQYNPFRNYQIRKILKKSVSKIISPSSALELALNQNGIKNTEVIPNGIDVNDWQCSDEEIGEFKKRFNLEGRNVVLFAGRLSLDKGAIPLLKAIDAIRKEIPNVTLLVAGEQRRWDGIAKAAGVTDELSPYIVNTGWLNHDDMRIANHAADVITVPSLCLDVFPSANLEAMAAGKPVIGTIFGGTPEIVEDGETGFIRNPLEQEEFTSSLLKLLKDDDLARRMGQAGLERVKNEYSLESQIERYVELFE